MKSNAALALTPGARSPTRDVLLTPAEVASWVKCSPRQVARLGLPFVRLGVKKLTRYRERDVQGWIAAQVQANGRRSTARRTQ